MGKSQSIWTAAVSMFNFVIRTCVPWVNLSQAPGHHTQPTCDQKPGAMAWPAANAIATDVRPHGVELQHEHALAPDRVRACQSWHLRRASSTHAPGSAQTHHDDQSLPRERESERESARGGEGERGRGGERQEKQRDRGREGERQGKERERGRLTRGLHHRLDGGTLGADDDSDLARLDAAATPPPATLSVRQPQR
eukprot:COSAG01_NODE_13356_length_1596_cov_4.219105_3_plen_196_part_00